MDSTRNTTSPEEARKRMRHMLKERLRRRRQESEDPVNQGKPDAPPLIHQAIQEEEKERAREARWASIADAVKDDSSPSVPFTPTRTLTTTPTPTTTETAPTPTPTETATAQDGWEQGDGRWAVQVVAYEGNLPPVVRERLVPTKETHFRFRHKENEDAFLSALSSPPQQLATYQPTGKKDVTLTSGDGRLLGNIHFLHMDGPDIHRPEKYYMKFYLFNFANAELLRDTKQRILQFLQGFSRGPKRTETARHTRPRPPPRYRRPTRRRDKSRRSRKSRSRSRRKYI